MKYIGSGLWALAAAYVEFNGNGVGSVVFMLIGLSIVFFGSNKPLVTITNWTRHKAESDKK